MRNCKTIHLQLQSGEEWSGGVVKLIYLGNDTCICEQESVRLGVIRTNRYNHQKNPFEFQKRD